jgi:hypothetical protein
VSIQEIIARQRDSPHGVCPTIAKARISEMKRQEIIDIFVKTLDVLDSDTLVSLFLLENSALQAEVDNDDLKEELRENTEEVLKSILCPCFMAKRGFKE